MGFKAPEPLLKGSPLQNPCGHQQEQNDEQQGLGQGVAGGGPVTYLLTVFTRADRSSSCFVEERPAATSPRPVGSEGSPGP